MLHLCNGAGKCLLLEVVEKYQNLSHQPELRLAVHFAAITIVESINQLLASKTSANRRPRYVESLRYYLNQFAKGRESRQLASFTTAEIEDWMAQYDGAFARRTWLSKLSPLFSFAVRRGYLGSNPCDRIDRVTVDMKPPLILTPEQADLMLKIVPTICRPYLILALYAGIRPEEITRMDWMAVNLETNTVAVDGKTRRRRIVRLEPKAAEFLAECPLRSGMVAPSPMTLRRFKHRARAALGLERFPQDLFRHTFASYALALHKDAGKVSTMMGNSSGVLLTHYHEPVSAADCKQFWQICPTKSDKVGLEAPSANGKAVAHGQADGQNLAAGIARDQGADGAARSERAAVAELHGDAGVQPVFEGFTQKNPTAQPAAINPT